MLVALRLSICTATANISTLGNENFMGDGEIPNKKVGLRVFAKKMKICTYIHVVKNSFQLLMQ
jgi:hypothetical protein